MLAGLRTVRSKLQLVLRPVAAGGGKRGTEQCVKFCFAEIRKITSIHKLWVDFRGRKEKQPLKYTADFFIDGLTNAVQCCTMLI